MSHWSGLRRLDFGLVLWTVLSGVAFVLAAPPVRGQSTVYVPYSGIIAGTQGADPVVLSLHNQTGQNLACSMALAHWYSQDLGVAAPGVALVMTLWHDPQTGVLNLLNASESRMPVEAVWCGTAGNINATRTRIALPFSRGDAPATLTADCRKAEGARLVCEVLQG